MAEEIERKFLIRSGGWRRLASGRKYRQGYLASVKERTVRVRTVGERGYLTVKGPSAGAVRLEFEYEIPLADANIMLERLCERPLIEKTRYKVDYDGSTWEIDEFDGENRGLIIAEVELNSRNQEINLPEWIGEEVTGDPRYFNANLVKKPYRRW